MIAISTESTADLSRQQFSYAGIQVVPVPLSHQGQVYDDQSMTPARLIEMIETSGQPALTIPITLSQCQAAFEQALQRASSLLHISTSPDISGHYPVALQAAQSFGERVKVINSGTVSYGLGLQVLHAAYLAEQQAKLNEIQAALHNLHQRQLFAFSARRLDFLKINGRVGNVRAMLGNLLGVQPVLNVHNGVIQSTANPRGGSAAIQNLVMQTFHFSQQLGEPLQLHFLNTVEGEAQAEQLRGTLLGHFPSAATSNTPIHPVGCGINANLGKGAISVLAMPAALKLPRGIELL